MLRRIRCLKQMRNAVHIGSALFFVFGALPAAAATLGIEFGAGTGLGGGDIRVIIARIIQAALGLMGIVVVVLIIYGGFLWMTAGGDEEKIGKAKKTIINAVIGLAIILSSYAITQFIVTRLIGATTGAGIGGPGFEQQVVSRLGDYSGDSLGDGIIQSHYPPPGATEVPRNTKIIVTFKLPMDPATIISNISSAAGAPLSGMLNAANVRIIRTRDIEANGIDQTAQEKFLKESEVDATATTDNRTFVFRPRERLGSSVDRVSYTVWLVGGENGIKLEDGAPAFAGRYIDGYRWEFETGTFVDVTPPKVLRVYPLSPPPQGATGFPRNSIIQVVFDEPVDPVTASGVTASVTPTFTNISVNNVGVGAVFGTWEPDSSFRIVEFRSDQLIGTNACGKNVYVLPANALLTVTITAAPVAAAGGEPEPPEATGAYPYPGVTDVAGNSLNGNGDDKASGPPIDSYVWSFSTSSVLDITSPHVAAQSPDFEGENVDLSAPVAITFDEPVSATSVSSSTVHLGVRPTTAPISYWVTVDPVDGSVANISHSRLIPSTGECASGLRAGESCAVTADCPSGTGTALCTLQRFDYYPEVTTGVTDLAQNCFFPGCGPKSDPGPSDPNRPFCCSGTACRESCIYDSNQKLVCASGG